MKSVGKQLQEARLSRNWTPELAARETKIKVDRVRDLEADDYTNFSSPTYARGFVRTYARALGLDEYKILRQLDNKLPEDDNASFATENGLPYVPESSQSNHVSSGSRAGLYVVLGLGFAVMLIISFVLLQAYRAGELPRYFANTSTQDTTNAATASAPVTDTEAPPHAVAVDPNDTTHSARAMPVDPNSLPISPVAATTTNTDVPAPTASATNTSPVVAAVAPSAAPTAPPDTNVAPITAVAPPANPNASAPSDEPIPMHALRALPVDPASLTNAGPETTSTVPPNPPVPAPPSNPVAPPEAAPTVASPTPTPGTVPLDTKAPPRALPVDPSELAATGAPETGTTVAATTMANNSNDSIPTAAPVAAPNSHARGLVISASRDSFVRVVALDPPQRNEVLYANVLRRGRSISFTGRKFSVDVSVPSAMNVVFDGVNYASPADGTTPETLTLESHLP